VHAFLELTPGRFGHQNLDLDKLRDASFWRDFHGLVVKQSTRIADLLGGLQGTPSTQNVDVAALLQEVISQQQSAFTGKGLELNAEATSGGLSGLNTDEPRLRQMLQLLLQSEWSRLPAGSKVSLSAQTVAEGAEAGSLLLTLVDNGPALSTSVLGSVFDPFHINAESEDATGLQLMGVYFLAHHLGGKITSPRSQSGRTFKITLPATPAAALTATDGSREFISNVLMNDTLWERLLPDG
jgi:signal transduction histidine kinase